MTYDLDLQSQPSLGQGQPPGQKSRSKVKQFKEESSDRHINGGTDGRTDGQTDRQTLPSTLSPCFAVDNYCINYIFSLSVGIVSLIIISAITCTLYIIIDVTMSEAAFIANTL